MAARKLAMNVIEHCADKLGPCIVQLLVSSLSDDNSYLDHSLDHHEVIYDIYQCAPQILTGIIPYITGELLVCFHSLDYILLIILTMFFFEMPLPTTFDN